MLYHEIIALLNKNIQISETLKIHNIDITLFI